MLAKTLQGLGLVAVVGLAATGLGALALVKDRVQITVQDPEAGAGEDPLALVRDDLQQVHGDLAAIAEALGTNLAGIGEALEAGARERASLREELLRMRDQLAAVRTVGEARGDDSPLDRAAAERAPVNGAPIGGETGSALAEPLADATAATDGRSAETAAQTTAESSASADKRGFLSFTLPSEGLAFDEPQHYRVLSSLSRVGFDAKSTLHDFTGVTSAVEGDVHANLADSSYRWHGEISCDASSLETGVEGRDEGMLEHLEVTAHPRIRFEITGFEAERVEVAARTASGIALGRLEIRGVSRDVRVPVSISQDESRRVVVSGQVVLHLPDWEVPVPNKLGVITMDEDVTMWLELRARGIGPAQALAGER